jgi:hypothetical protein
VQQSLLSSCWNCELMFAETGSTAWLAGMFLPGAGLGEVAVVVLYIRIRSTVAELASNGWTACGDPGGFFFDDAFALVTVMAFGHGSIGCAGSAIGDTQSVWD